MARTALGTGRLSSRHPRLVARMAASALGSGAIGPGGVTAFDGRPALASSSVFGKEGSRAAPLAEARPKAPPSTRATGATLRVGVPVSPGAGARSFRGRKEASEANDARIRRDGIVGKLTMHKILKRSPGLGPSPVPFGDARTVAIGNPWNTSIGTTRRSRSIFPGRRLRPA